MDYIHPHFLPNGEQPAMEMKRVPRDPALGGTTEEYVEGDLAVVGANGLSKYTDTALGLVGLAGADWAQPYAKQYFLDRGVVVNLIPEANEFVFTYQGAAADGADHVFTAADLLAVQQGEIRDVIFNTTEECATVRDSTGTANTIQVQLRAVYSGAVGDTNVQVVGRIVRASLLS